MSLTKHPPEGFPSIRDGEHAELLACNERTSQRMGTSTIFDEVSKYKLTIITQSIGRRYSRPVSRTVGTKYEPPRGSLETSTEVRARAVLQCLTWIEWFCMVTGVIRQ